jgi:peptidoglycan/LPS O-acetylase OafA/YrhL
MFGIYSVFLAILVLISHFGLSIRGYNPGVLAVVSFFLISGYTMSSRLTSSTPVTCKQIFHFFIDRLQRLYPIYFLIVILTYVAITYLPFAEYITLGKRYWLFNLIVIPLNYWHFTPMLMFTVHGIPFYALIPQAWWLALEIQFFLISPLLVKYRLFRIFAFWASILVWILAALHYLEPLYFGYHLLPGVLFIYLFGMEMYHYRNQRIIPFYLILIWLMLFPTIGFLIYRHLYQSTFNLEILVGLIFGLPLVRFLSHRVYQTHSLDSYIGHLAYPIFISHFLVIWLIQYYFPTLDLYPQLLMTIFATIFTSWFLYTLIDKPLTALRHHRRNLLRSR